MEVAKARHIGRVACAGLGMTLLASTPAFAQQLSLIEMFQTMGPTAIAVAVVLFIMSFWSIGVAIERIYTFNQARKRAGVGKNVGFMRSEPWLGKRVSGPCEKVALQQVRPGVHEFVPLLGGFDALCGNDDA